jgi:hypothetical protein
MQRACRSRATQAGCITYVGDVGILENVLKDAGLEGI